jgi:hypothetical protein
MLLPEDMIPMALTQYWKALGRGYWGPGCVLSRDMRIRHTRLIGEKILPAHGYRDSRLLSVLVIFKLVVSSRSSGEVGPHLLWGNRAISRFSGL